MSRVLRTNQSKLPDRRPSKAVTSRPALKVSMVSQVMRALTMPGIEAVLPWAPSSSQELLPEPTGMVW